MTDVSSLRIRANIKNLTSQNVEAGAKLEMA